MPTIKCVNYAIRYEKWGKKTDLPPMIFLHGHNNNITGWYKQIPYFCKLTEVYAYDQIGHGKSSKSRDINYSMNLLIAILYQFIKKLKINKPILIGHSMGGMVIQSFALKHPEMLSKLILVCTGPYLLPKPIKNAPNFLHPIAVILSKLYKPYTYLMFSLPHQTLTKNEVNNDKKRAFATDPFASFKLAGVILDYNIKDEISQIKNKMLFITGTHDLFYNQVSFYRKLGAKVKIIKDGEHNLHGHFYKEVNEIIYKFISD
ncbi:MAG: alpha/beta fold hydrolase [Candidatus Helarchaeota archaeon]